jgi:molybdenum ABC transporter ATP-binding protein
MDPALVASVTVPLREFALDVSLRAEAARTLAVAGLSGAGKTTLLRVIAGLVRPSSGRIACGGETWFDAAAGVFVPVERRAVGIVFQDLALFPHLDARTNVAFPLESAGVGRGERRRRADALLDRLGIRSLGSVRPAALSGGERQRVAIARALARDPRVLLLDEPLASLDPTTRGQVTAELRALLRDLGLTTVLVTHSYDDATTLADRVAVIERGRIVQEGTATELLAAPASSFVADFAGVNYLAGTASRHPDGLTHVRVDGGVIVVAEEGEGPVGVVIPPWAIVVAGEGGSARNALTGTVARLTPLGNRVRVTVHVPAPITAELTRVAADELDLQPGRLVTLRFKAAECRLAPRVA